MTVNTSIPVPTREEFLRGCEMFRLHEPRDAMYKVATYLVGQFWGQPVDMADGLGVLLLTWNQAFYRFGSFSFYALERCIASNLAVLQAYRGRDILTLAQVDENVVKQLFTAFLDALKIDSGKNRGRVSPVSAAKALHLLGPSFFPLWDQAIAGSYGCFYDVLPAASYLRFSHITAQIVQQIQHYAPDSSRTILKRIDEYNYAKFTKGWV